MKKIIFNFTFNSILFLILVLGIQNSSKKEKIFLLNNESVNLPISFIVGISFIGGSIAGGLLQFNLKD